MQEENLISTCKSFKSLVGIKETRQFLENGGYVRKLLATAWPYYHQSPLKSLPKQCLIAVDRSASNIQNQSHPTDPLAGFVFTDSARNPVKSRPSFSQTLRRVQGYSVSFRTPPTSRTRKTCFSNRLPLSLFLFSCSTKDTTIYPRRAPSTFSIFLPLGTKKGWSHPLVQTPRDSRLRQSNL